MKTNPFSGILKLGLVTAAAANAVAAIPQLDTTIYRDPELPQRALQHIIPPAMLELWLGALGAAEADLQREAATMILRCHQQGYPGLQETADDLIAAMKTSRHPVAQRSIVLALIELDVRQSASLLFEFMRTGGTTEALIAEPALARWNFTPAQQIWRERLARPDTARQLLRLAIACTRTSADRDAVPALREIVLSSVVEQEIRVDAAAALGELQSEGLTEAARRLARNRSPVALVNRIVAARMLSHHSGNDAVALLLELAVDAAPTVAAIALGRLLEIDPDLVKPVVPQTLRRSDANLRRLAAKALVQRPAVDVFESLGDLLDDISPSVRDYVRESMLQLADQPEFDAVARTTAVQILASDNWRALEQSALLLADLDHKAAAPRLVELLRFDRPEVCVTAAWALRVLAVKETLPDMLAFAAETVRTGSTGKSGAVISEADAVSLSHLFEAFGALKYPDADGLLREFVPRRRDGETARAAAIWALGYLHENQPEAVLIEMLKQRVTDMSIIPKAEPLEVRAMAAVSLGRMNAQSVLPEMQSLYGYLPPGDLIHKACVWAIEQMTGEDLPPPPERPVIPLTGFLLPLEP